MKLWKKIYLTVSVLTPSFAFAQVQKPELTGASCKNIKTISDIFSCLTGLLQDLIPVLFAVAIVVFIWGVISYITAAGDAEKRREGIQYIIWGLVGIFVMTAIWGLVGILVGTFDIKFGIPQLKTGD